MHFPLSSLDVHERESRPASKIPLQELEFNTQLQVNDKANPIYAPVPNSDHVPDVVLIEGIVIKDVVPANASNASMNIPDGMPPGTPRTHLKYPTKSHDNQNERWGVRIDLKYPIPGCHNHEERWGAWIQYHSEYNRCDWYSRKQTASETVAAGYITMHHIPSSDILADEMTKHMSHRPVWNHIHTKFNWMGINTCNDHSFVKLLDKDKTESASTGIYPYKRWGVTKCNQSNSE